MAAPKEVEIKFLVSDPTSLHATLQRRLSLRHTVHPRIQYALRPSRTKAPSQRRVAPPAQVWRHVDAHPQGSRQARQIQVTRRAGDRRRRRNTNGLILRALGYRACLCVREVSLRVERWQGPRRARPHPHRRRRRDRRARRAGSIAPRKRSASTPSDYITKSYAELFFEWKRKYKRKAKNMTFRECGGRAKVAIKHS